MTRTIAPLAGLAALALGADAAPAASPAYCALYAKEFVRHAVAESQGSLPPERVHDRAYYRCLNMDEEPILPTAYADPAEDGVGGPFVAQEPEEEGSFGFADGDGMADDTAVDATAIDEAIVKETAALEPDPPAKPRRTGKHRGSGFAMWSAEWKAWCTRHFPNSFDPKTGTIVPLKTGKRTACR